jgi:pimeloyl-ACP methyl ester carboxylesterase
VKGDLHELRLRPTIHPGRPRIRVRRAEPPGRIHRLVPKPLYRHRWTAIGGEQPPGYDPGTLADDLVALMGALGHQRFAVVGTDIGLPVRAAFRSPRSRRSS